ncbi:MarR family winged helix-turn-helix transcriptional regulator [Roseicyclus sp. F158]|uniref:MarR family winged helix-turn-helix transcriptional regulator n=1 Tax=Tropicimonas omnivorans TaxID=3075590 RepID=A0ABU3DE85_9RHOB|nr:MarR family winged helix-turn-helix transcriptional regulator [Roseicyclus sp. F158]MDT0682031.1 MarR family winged helix-turn-helix transcriptional regulator [Roseicyclus sp. F158]
MGSHSPDRTDAPKYGGLMLKGDLLGAADIPAGASVIHVIAMRLKRALGKEQAEILERVGGISVPEWRVLFMLADAGSMTQRELVNRTVIEQSQASRIMKTMEDAGLVVMERDKVDRRRWICSLTADGQALFDKVEPAMRQRRERIDGTLTSSEMLQFLEFANRIAAQASGISSNPSEESEPIGSGDATHIRETKT